MEYYPHKSLWGGGNTPPQTQFFTSIGGHKIAARCVCHQRYLFPPPPQHCLACTLPPLQNRSRGGGKIGSRGVNQKLRHAPLKQFPPQDFFFLRAWSHVMSYIHIPSQWSVEVLSIMMGGGTGRGGLYKRVCRIGLISNVNEGGGQFRALPPPP